MSLHRIIILPPILFLSPDVPPPYTCHAHHLLIDQTSSFPHSCHHVTLLTLPLPCDIPHKQQLRNYQNHYHHHYHHLHYRASQQFTTNLKLHKSQRYRGQYMYTPLLIIANPGNNNNSSVDGHSHELLAQTLTKVDIHSL